MKLGVMQPYFFPYFGYFALINQVDFFVLLDTVQFIKHGWIERNQILKASDGEPLYIKAPLVKHPLNTSIRDIRIRDNEPWREKIFAQLAPYKKKAPHYNEVIALLTEIFELNTDSIVEINRRALEIVCQYLRIGTPIGVWSEMKIEIDQPRAPDEWALNISKALGARTYINPTAGKHLFNNAKYRSAGIDLRFIEVNPVQYNQRLTEEFVPNMSILEILMCCDLEEIHSMLHNYRITAKC